MRSRIPFIQNRLKTVMNAANGPGTAVTVSWTQFTGSTTTDLVTQSTIGTGSRASTRMNAFVHFVQIGSSAVKVFNEIEVGDVIVDLPGSYPDGTPVDLDGKVDLQFVIAGETYVPKVASDKLAKNWDAVVGNGVQLTRTLLLRKAT